MISWLSNKEGVLSWIRIAFDKRFLKDTQGRYGADLSQRSEEERATRRRKTFLAAASGDVMKRRAVCVCGVCFGRRNKQTDWPRMC